MTSIPIIKLKLTHAFLSNRRIARRLLKDEHKAEVVLKEVQDMIKEDLKLIGELGTSEEIIATVQWFVEKAKDFYNKALFGAEKHLLIYLLRNTESFSNMVGSLKEEFEKAHKISQAAIANEAYMQQYKELIAQAEQEEHDLQDAIVNMFRLVRRAERHEHQAFSDRILRVDQHAQFRHRLKQLRREQGDSQHEIKDENKLIDILDHKFTKIMKKSQKNVNFSDEESDIKKALDELHNHMKKEFAILKAMFDDALFIIKYALAEFFEFESYIELVQGYINELESKNFIIPATRLNCNQELQQLEAYKKDHEKEIFRIMKKFRNQTKKQLK